MIIITLKILSLNHNVMPCEPSILCFYNLLEALTLHVRHNINRVVLLKKIS